MHSAELARLAGVTVRALRHYHQVGVLPEPARTSNGYRTYDVHDLIRVVRITRLASVGIPLERMPELLDGSQDGQGADDGGLLDELDAELEEKIARLTAQRDLIARLRALDAPPDVPPELAPFLAAFASRGISPDLVRMDREQSVLLAHLVGEEGMPRLTRFYERISDPEIAPAIVDIMQRFDGLGVDATQSEIDDLVESFVATVALLLDEFQDEADLSDLTGSEDLIADYSDSSLNEQQRRALAQLSEALERRSRQNP